MAHQRQRPVVTLQDSLLVLTFPYDQGQVDRIKQIPGAKWDRVDRVWRCPLTSIAPIRAFADRYGFDLDTELQTYEAPEHLISESPLTRDGEQWTVALRYDPIAIKQFKEQVTGAQWDRARGCWKVPLAQSPALLAWATHTNQDIPNELRELDQHYRSQATRLKELSNALDADIEIKTAIPLKHFQKAGVAYVAEARRCFIGDQMGLGKTSQALASAQYLDKYPMLVVCPANLTLNWAAEAEKFTPWRTTEIIAGKKPYETQSADITIISWAVLKEWEPKLRGFQTVVYDESHFAKGASQRARAAKLVAKRVPDDGLVLLLTGTPIVNRPVEFANQLDIIDRLRAFGGKTEFTNRYCAAFVDSWGRRNVTGSSNLAELHDRLRGMCYVRRTTKDALPELEPVRHAPMPIEPDPKEMRVYLKAEADIILFLEQQARDLAELAGEDPDPAALKAKKTAQRAEAIVKLTTLRRLAARTKMKAIAEWVEARRDAEVKVILAGHHRDIVDEITVLAGGLKIQGGMKVTEVEEAKRRFQELPVDMAPAIVLSIEAAKVGHNLTAAEEVAFVEFPWSPADLDQVIARAHRIGQRGSVLATYFIARGTLDEPIYRLIQEKRKIVDAATDGKTPMNDISVVDALVKSLLKQGRDR